MPNWPLQEIQEERLGAEYDERTTQKDSAKVRAQTNSKKNKSGEESDGVPSDSQGSFYRAK